MIKRIRGIWEYKYLIYNLVARDLKVKYKGSTLGFVWSLLNPLLMLVVYTVAFKFVLKVKVENFTIFLFSALLPWNFLSSALSVGVSSITENGNLVKKVYFPREILPLSGVLVNLFHFFLTFTVLIPALFFFDVRPGLPFLLLPLLILFQTFFVLGLTLIFAAMNVYYRDAKHFLEVLLQLWFWVTPIIWPVQLVKENLPKYVDLLYLNPFTPFVEAYRDIILYDRFPRASILLLVAIIGILVFLAGEFTFRKKQRRFAEEI
ncbi:MAG: ABC transporter permease [bacterium]|nr:ABC transporter permease [bacterium]